MNGPNDVEISDQKPWFRLGGVSYERGKGLVSYLRKQGRIVLNWIGSYPLVYIQKTMKITIFKFGKSTINGNFP